ncbi:PREDICTED: uncharacterized protein LOC109168886 [Ipomoea nil]|uniref:uncharacterized protein LOC109168886 n=1 Tax=Ipomoea nil TaxID=35883 RepID=UPI00090138C5|nr:PREDICTED: uncharacterized protein LOC109168886 [Ipomoea nil]
MVSEPPRRFSYAAAVSGEGSHERNTASPLIRSPARNATSAPQRNSNLQTQRNYGTEDMENPLFLSVNENPSAILVSPPLVGSSNYTSWCISMRIALEVKNKWWIVNGSDSTPSRESIQYAAWRRCNLIVCSWIFKSIHTSIAQSVMHLDKARDVWEDLRKRFAQCDAQRISTLQNEINNLKQGNLSVSDYYTKCRTMWEEMNILRPLPICKCDPRCDCGLVDEIRRERDVDQLIRFLQGLKDDFNSLKSNVLVLDPLPEVYKVYVMAEKVERQIGMTNMNMSSLEVGQANAVQMNNIPAEEIVATVNNYNGKRYTNNGGNKPKCVFCGMMGHTIDKCYKKHGYPPGWVPGFKSKMKQQTAAPVMTDWASC